MSVAGFSIFWVPLARNIIYSPDRPAECRLDLTASAVILIDLADEINDYEMVRDLSEQWSDQHKLQVWALLPPELQTKYKILKQKYDEL